MGIADMLQQQLLKAIIAEEDAKFIACVDRVLNGQKADDTCKK
jgi:hypothetical protein